MGARTDDALAAKRPNDRRTPHHPGATRAVTNAVHSALFGAFFVVGAFVFVTVITPPLWLLGLAVPSARTCSRRIALGFYRAVLWFLERIGAVRVEEVRGADTVEVVHMSVDLPAGEARPPGR